MLSHLLQIAQRRIQLLHHRRHATQRSAFERLAPIERIAISFKRKQMRPKELGFFWQLLEETNIVFGNAVNETHRLIQRAESNLVVIAIVEHVDHIGVEGMHVVQTRELVQDALNLVVKRLLSVFDLAHVKRANAVNVVAPVRANHVKTKNLPLSRPPSCHPYL